MEQQKILWVLLSVLAVLMVVVMAGVFLYYPGQGTPRAAAAGETRSPAGGSRKQPSDFDPIEYIKEKEEAPGLEKPVEDKKPDGSDREEEEDMFVVTVMEDSTGQDGRSGGSSGMAPEPVETVVSPRSAEPADSRDSSGAAEDGPASAEETGADSEKEKPRKPRRETVKTYWIQVGSFTERNVAGGVKENLASRGIGSTISTTQVEDTVYYRVRVGHFPNKEEAETFCRKLQGVSGFEGSYVSAVWTTRDAAAEARRASVN